MANEVVGAMPKMDELKAKLQECLDMCDEMGGEGNPDGGEGEMPAADEGKISNALKMGMK